MTRRALLAVAAGSMACSAQEIRFEYTAFDGPASQSASMRIANNRGVLFLYQPLQEGGAIGVFQGELPPSFVERIAKAMPQSFESPVPLSPGMANHMFTLTTPAGTRSIRVPQFPTALARVSELVAAVEAAQAELARKPERGLRMRLRKTGNQEAVIALENPGRRSVLIEAPDRSLRVELESPAGSGDWKEAGRPKGSSLHIAGGATQSLVVPLTPAARAGGRLRARYSAAGVMDGGGELVYGDLFAVADGPAR